ncbi:MAG TPA: hypothetical protein VGG48_08205 [Rhizomicrobium sp.]
MTPFSILGGKPCELISPLRRADCVARLKESVGSFWNPLSSAAVAGTVRDGAITLRRNMRYRNSFQTFLRAHLSDDPQGTRISCRFGMHWIIQIFLIAWFGGVLFSGWSIATQTIAEAHGNVLSGHVLIGVFMPVLMAFFGVLITLMGRFFARNERDELLAFLRETLSARDVVNAVSPVAD